MKKILFLSLLTISLSTSAQNKTVSEKRNFLSVEIDPAPFILGGYSVSLKYSPEKLSNLTFMGSVYSSRLPDNLISKSNKAKGWENLQLETSYAFFADYFLNNKRTGFHFGASVFLYNKSVELNESPVRVEFTTIYPNLRVGYVYRPFKKCGFYVNPWVNFGKESPVDDGNKLNVVEYSFEGINYVMALHLGYEINF
jgi:hypothetical protein